VSTDKPEERFSRAELRYRIADYVNDRLKAIPYVHRILKRLVHWLQHRRDVRQIAAARSHARTDIAPSQQTGQVIRESRALPMPPLEMRRLVGPFDEQSYDNPTGALVYPWLRVESYDRVFDFGCGCGRVARQLLMQKPNPKLYVGIDLNAEMIRWCNDNLHPVAPHFNFHHHDVFNVNYNPDRTRPLTAPFPARDAQFTLVNALSVFTHLTESQAEYYLRECARGLDPRGVLHASWFLFDKADHPMMSEDSNALYVSYVDPSAAVIFDRQWVRNTARELGLRIFQVIPPGIRGYQWLVLMTPRTDVPEVELPPDTAPRGVVKPNREVSYAE